MRRWIIIRLTLAFVSAASILTPGLLRVLAQSAPLDTADLDRAFHAVGRNQDWEPILRQSNGLEVMLVPTGCFMMGKTVLQLESALESCERFFGSGNCQIDFQALEQPPYEKCIDQPFWIGLTKVTNRQYGTPRYTEKEGHYRGRSWPVEAVSWEEARHFCEANGMRLPTEVEWEYAARGPDSVIYPWGDPFDLDRLVWGMLNPDDVAQYTAGASWVGALDRSGGVAEWAEDLFKPYDSQ